jgi:hypothetical protein
MADQIFKVGAVEDLESAGEWGKFDAKDRAAQRGAELPYAILSHLFTKRCGGGAPGSSASGPPSISAAPSQGNYLFGSNDIVEILDFFPFSGDCMLASSKLQADINFAASLRHSSVEMEYKGGKKASAFARARLATHLAKKWQAREFLLYEFEGQQGSLAHPMDARFQVDQEKLKELPGCYEAWKGITKLDDTLKVCKLQAKKFAIAPELLAEFQSAPAPVAEALRALQEEHENSCADLLAHLVEDPNKHADEEDPRVTASEADPKEDDEAGRPSPSLAVWESEEALRKEVTVVSEAKASGDRNVLMLRDDKHNVYLLAREQHLLKKHTILGSVGAGKMQDTKSDSQNKAKIIPFRLEEGDRSVVALIKSATNPEDGDDTTGNQSVGTVYTTVKGLEKTCGGKPISITSYGKIQPGTQGLGKHGYNFEFGDSDKAFKSIEYVLKDIGDKAEKVSSGNFFRALVGEAQAKHLKGYLLLLWRVQFLSVHSRLAVRKPHFCITQQVTLEKNKPVKVAWV